MKKLQYLLLVLLNMNLYSQKTEEIHAFYLQEIPGLATFCKNSVDYSPKKLDQLFKETCTLPRVNSKNSKFYKVGGKSIFEIYHDYDKKNITLKVVSENDQRCVIHLFSNGKVKHEIPYVNGKADGVYKVFSTDGSLLFETAYANGKMNGVRRFYPQSKDAIMEANYSNGSLTGKIKVIQPDYNVFLLYPGNLTNGTIEYYDMDSNLFCEVPFIEGNVVDGEVIDYHYRSKNKRLVRNHRRGRLDGKTEYFDEQGKSKCILNFSDGMPIGEHKEFYLIAGGHLGGIYKESFYDQHGIKTGTWKTYDENGKLSSEVPYVNGKKNGLERMYSEGTLTASREYVDDKLNGPWKTWNRETKSLKSESQMVNDKTMSTTFYFKSGRISKRYENNLDNQPVRAEYFDKNGNLFYEEKYNPDKSSEGTHKYYFYDKNEDYFLGNEDEFDKTGFKVRDKVYMGNDGYEETIYKKNGLRTKTVYKDKVTTVEYYYFYKRITVEEFQKLDK